MRNRSLHLEQVAEAKKWLEWGVGAFARAVLLIEFIEPLVHPQLSRLDSLKGLADRFRPFFRGGGVHLNLLLGTVTGNDRPRGG